MNSYKSKAIFYLPGVFQQKNMYALLMTEYVNHKEKFKNNVEIGCVYDSPMCVWNGGRLSTVHYGKEELEEIRDFYKNIDIPVRFTFTNCLLENKHIGDVYGNLLLEIFNTGRNEIICNSQVLEDYIRTKYKKSFKYISSTTKRLSDKDEQSDELKKDYYLVVLDYDHNKDFDFLNSIKKKKKCELLCNPVCSPNCPKRKAHYIKISKGQIDNEHSLNFPCQDQGRMYYQVKNLPNYIGPNDIDTYLDMGYNHFKLEGRTAAPSDLIEILVDYLIKDDYALEMRERLQQTIW